MNNDLISRKALIEAYDKAHKGPPGGARKLMEEAPGVDAAPVVQGRWTCDSEDGFENYDWHCSQCGGSIPYRCGNPKFTNYCPHCGAKMDGGKEK